MKSKVTWKLDLAVNEIKIPLQDTMQVEAYDKCDVYVDKNGQANALVQPGNADDIQFLLILRDPKAEVDPNADPNAITNNDPTVTYSINGSPWIRLDYVHLIIGDGALKLLQLKDPPHTIQFKNGTSKGVWVTVLVGRKANVEEKSTANSSNEASVLRNTPIGQDNEAQVLPAAQPAGYNENAPNQAGQIGRPNGGGAGSTTTGGTTGYVK